MLTLLTLLKHDIRDSRLYKFRISCPFSNVYIIQKSTQSLMTCATFHTMPFFIGGIFHPVLNPHPGRQPSAAVSTAYSIALKLSSIHRSHFLCHTMVSGMACTHIALILFLYCLPSLNMLTYSMLCTCAYETAWSLKIGSIHTRAYQMRERNRHEFTDASHSAPNQHKCHSVHV